MAFRLRHWILTVVAGCALVAVAYLPPGSRGSSSPYWVRYETRQYGRRMPRSDYLERLLTRAESQLHWMDLRDSLLRVADDSAVTENTPVLFFETELPTFQRERAVAFLRSERQPLHGRQGAADVLIAVNADSTSFPDADWVWITYARSYYTPLATDGRRCLAEVWLRKRPESHGNQEARLARAAGPCAYYAAFGRPGAAIEAWLLETDHAAALDPAWTTGQRRAVELQPSERSPRQQFWNSPYLVECAAGNRPRCSAGVKAAANLDNIWRLWPYSLAQRRGMVHLRYYWNHGMGGQFDLYLSDLLTQMGEERFARFWSSSTSLEEGFVAAFDVALEDWTMEWARRQIGTPPAGPMASASSAALALVLAGVAVAGSLLWATRRKVS